MVCLAAIYNVRLNSGVAISSVAIPNTNRKSRSMRMAAKPPSLISKSKLGYQLVANPELEGVFQCPRVKSGNFCGAPRAATEASLNGVGALQAAAS